MINRSAAVHGREASLPVLFWVLLVAAALLRLYLVCLDRNILMDQGLLQDDAFYYYEIALHLLASGVPSFDGINPTNGFHPLWQAICLPVFYFFDQDSAPRVMLLMASVLDLASLYLVYQLLRQWLRNEAAVLVAVAILALHGTLIRTWFNGLETALQLFTLLLFMRAYFALSATAHVRQHLLLGAWAALAFLARTDSAVIMAVMLCWLYLPGMLRLQSSRPSFRPWRGACACGASLLLLTAPWLLWNYLTFGNIVQVSGQHSGNVWLTGGALPELPFPQNVLFGIQTSIDPLRIVLEKMFQPYPLPKISGFIYLLLLMVLVAGAAWRDSPTRRALWRLAPLVLGALVLFFYHAGVRHFVRGWYNGPLLLCGALLLALLADHLLTAWRWRFAGPCLLAALCLLLLAGYSPLYYSGFGDREARQQDPRVAAALWLETHTAADERSGAANAGIVGYYTSRPLINLDGVVNETAFRARQANELQRYILETRIHWLADHKGSLDHLCADNSYYRCEEAGRWNNGTRVMRVVPLGHQGP